MKKLFIIFTFFKMPTKTKKEPQKRRSRSHEPITRYGSQRNLRSASANSSVVSYNGFQVIIFLFDSSVFWFVISNVSSSDILLQLFLLQMNFSFF